MTKPLPPVRRSIVVPWDPEAAFRRFTTEIASWWPYRTHSVGGKRVKTIGFDGRVGGDIYEEHIDGRRFKWGTVLEWDPPSLVRFTWHPSQSESTAQDVEVRFSKEGSGTKLDLVHSGFEKFGAKAERAHRGYNLGWRYVLEVCAGRRSGFVRIMDWMAAMIGLVSRLKPGAKDPRDEAQGEMPASVR